MTEKEKVIQEKSKEKKKIRINKLAIFNVVSILFILAFIINYSVRFFYFKNQQTTGSHLSDILSERLILTLNPMLFERNGVYYYEGDVNNNYVQFMGYMWQVMKINDDGSTTMIMKEPITAFSFGSGDNWTETHIHHWLNYDKDILFSGVFENTLDTSFLTYTTTCIDIIDSIDNITCNEKESNSLITLPTLYDYYSSGGHNGFLNNDESFWTISSTEDNHYWFVSEDSAVSIAAKNEMYNLRPVITLVPETNVFGGNGELDTPYIVKKRNVSLTKHLFVGEFVEYNDLIWRIIRNDNDSITLALNDCLKDDEDNCMIVPFSATDNLFVTSNRDNLLSYLNSEFFNSLDNSDFIITGTFNSGYYSAAVPNFINVFSKTNQANVGLLSIADPFAFSIPNVFLLNTLENHEFSIFTVNQNNLLFQEQVWSEHYIRPVITLRSNISITGGLGRIYSPYQLGGVTND